MSSWRRGRKGNDKNRRKIIVYIATSADGYIARADGSVDWLNRPRPAGSTHVSASIDTVLLGRKTYDQALKMTGGQGVGSVPSQLCGVAELCGG